MVNRILIDTNILLDYLLTREPFYKNAEKIVHACVEGQVKGCIAAHSISNMFFILRKDYNAKERREVLTNIRNTGYFARRLFNIIKTFKRKPQHTGFPFD